MEVRAERNFVPKETTTERKMEQRLDVRDARVAALGSQWDGHLPPVEVLGCGGQLVGHGALSQFPPAQGGAELGGGGDSGPRASCDSALVSVLEGGVEAERGLCKIEGDRNTRGLLHLGWSEKRGRGHCMGL